MSQTQVKFRYNSKNRSFRNFMDVQKSVNSLFDIFEEYGRLEKKLSDIKMLEG
jgi:hypothetical protein